MTKYCGDSSFGYNGFTDNKTILDPEDDAAHVNWGGAWRTPTDAEMTELREQCTWTWTKENGVYGYRVTSMIPGYTDRSIFLPAAGGRGGKNIYGIDYDGRYWSSSLNTRESSMAWCIYFVNGDMEKEIDDVSVTSISRHNGQSIRPVCP
jgi:hypothetical protein